MDMSAGYAKSVARPGHAPQAVISSYDPFHVVGLADEGGARYCPPPGLERHAPPRPGRRETLQWGARWSLLKNPQNPERRAGRHPAPREVRRRGGDLWRAYTLKEALRAIFAGDLEQPEVAYLLDRFCSRAQRSGLKPFVTLAKTIRKHHAGILAAVELGVNNARHEALNRRVRQIINRAYGFHSPQAALALIMLTVGLIAHILPHERPLAT